MTLLLINSNKKTSLTKSQSNFNRLIKKIEKFQNIIKETEEILNVGLDYYFSIIRPMEAKVVEKLSDCIPVFYSYYNNPHSKLSKNEHKILKELIHSLLKQLCDYVSPRELNPKIIEIFEDIEGIDFQELLDGEFHLLKQNLGDFAAKQGLDINLDELDLTDSTEQLQAKIQEAILEASKNEKIDSVDDIEKPKEKTKQQLQKEQEAKEVEEIQKKGLSKIYKQLAKEFHPDLELNPTLKAEKEALMKKLTLAYEKHDLHTLLSLQIEWMNRNALNESQFGFQNADEQLKIYNAILKDQVESLEQEFYSMFHHPRYAEMQHILEKSFISKSYRSSILGTLKEEEGQLDSDIDRYDSAITDLKDGSNFKKVQRILKDFSCSPEELVAEMVFSLLTN